MEWGFKFINEGSNISNMNNSASSIRIGGGLWLLDSPKVMGIVNATPDSFFPGSRNIAGHGETGKADLRYRVRERVERMLSEGADCIDIGGYSSRPGCEDISVEEEYTRLCYALEGAREAGGDALIISVDTFRSEIARRCVEEWDVQIINDIGGGTLDKDMFATVADLGVAYVLMHMRGTPQNMTSLTGYDDVTRDVISDLAFKVDQLHSLGVADIILDPGFGFAKNADQNFRLLRELMEFKKTGLPILAGLSRKSMIYKLLGVTPEDALNGTTALNLVALMNGADILRVHDVREAKECVKLYGQLVKD